MSNAAILLAGGKSSRMGEHMDDKILIKLNGQPAIYYCARAFLESNTVSQFVVVHRDRAQRELIHEILTPLIGNKIEISWVEAGEERQDSVCNGLEAISPEHDYVFIHDCARPLIRPESIKALEQLARKNEAASLAHPVSDTIKHAECDHAGTGVCTLKDIDRHHLWAMETPQVFKLSLILDAYRQVRSENRRITDDTAAVSVIQQKVALLDPEYPNVKLTTVADLPYVEFLLRNQENTPTMPLNK